MNSEMTYFVRYPSLTLLNLFDTTEGASLSSSLRAGSLNYFRRREEWRGVTFLRPIPLADENNNFLQKLTFHSIFLPRSKIAICQVLKLPPKQDSLINKNKHKIKEEKKKKVRKKKASVNYTHFSFGRVC